MKTSFSYEISQRESWNNSYKTNYLNKNNIEKTTNKVVINTTSNNNNTVSNKINNRNSNGNTTHRVPNAPNNNSNNNMRDQSFKNKNVVNKISNLNDNSYNNTNINTTNNNITNIINNNTSKNTKIDSTIDRNNFESFNSFKPPKDSENMTRNDNPFPSGPFQQQSNTPYNTTTKYSNSLPLSQYPFKSSFSSLNQENAVVTSSNRSLMFNDDLCRNLQPTPHNFYYNYSSSYIFNSDSLNTPNNLHLGVLSPSCNNNNNNNFGLNFFPPFNNNNNTTSIVIEPNSHLDTCDSPTLKKSFQPHLKTPPKTMPFEIRRVYIWVVENYEFFIEKMNFCFIFLRFLKHFNFYVNNKIFNNYHLFGVKNIELIKLSIDIGTRLHKQANRTAFWLTQASWKHHHLTHPLHSLQLFNASKFQK